MERAATTTSERARATALAGLAVVVAVLALLLPTPPAGAEPAAAEAAFVSSINAVRTARGLPTLTVDDELTALGRSWAARMAEAGEIWHNPGLASAVHADWEKLGENVGTGPQVAALHQAFLDSPTHLANIVDPAFTHIGVGVVERDGVLYTAHQFMALRPPAPAPAPVAPPTAPLAAPAPPVATTTPTAAVPATAAAAPTGSQPVPVLTAVLSGLRRLDATA